MQLAALNSVLESEIAASARPAHQARQALPAEAIGRLAWRWDPVKIGLFVLTVIAVSRIHQHWTVIGKMRPALLMVALLAFYTLANPRSVNADNMVKYWPSKLIIGMCVLAYLSIPFGISMGNSGIFVLDTYSKTIVYALLLLVSVRVVGDMYFHAWAYTIGAGLLCYLSLFVFGLQKYDGYARLSHMYTYDANDSGLVVLLGLPLALLLIQTAKPLGKLVSFAVVVMICATIARTGSRGAFVGLLAVALAFLFIVRSTSIIRKIVFVTVGVVGLGAWAPEGYFKQMETILKPEDDYNLASKEGRKAVAKRGLGYMLAYPVFGLGINNFAKAECTLSEKAKKYVSGNPMRCTPPHNTYVQAGAELGVGGLLAMVALIWGGMVSMIRLSLRVPKSWSAGSRQQRFVAMAPQYIAVSAVGFGVSCFFLSFAWMDVTYFLAAMYVGAHAMVDDALAKDAASRRSPSIPAAPAPYRAGGSASVSGNGALLRPRRAPILAPSR